MPFRLARACAGVLVLAGAPHLAGQQSAATDVLDGGLGVVRAHLSVEDAAAAAGVPLLDPAPLVDGFAPWFVGSVDRLMDEAITDGVAPGAAVVVGHRGRVVLAKGWGRTDSAAGAPAATVATVWDLASVTKVAATTVGAMVLVQDGALDLDAPVARYLPGWPADGDRGRITVRDLLGHTSGLAVGAPVGRGGRAELIARLARVPLRAAPGTDEEYGDLDMVLLGAVLEAVAGEPLDQLLARRVYARLGMTETAFRPLDAGIALERVAPTERIPSGLIHGVVHDPIARDLGGVSGNAGLFASARDLATLASALLWEVPDRVACRAVVRDFTQPSLTGRYALGWESAAAGTMWGELFSRFAFGHVGYTGTSLWIDPERDVFVVLLSNRVNPSARNQKHLELRWALHAAVQRGLGDLGEGWPPLATPRDGCLGDQIAAAIRRLPPVRWLR